MWIKKCAIVIWKAITMDCYKKQHWSYFRFSSLLFEPVWRTYITIPSSPSNSLYCMIHSLIGGVRPLIKSDRYDLTNWKPWGHSGQSEVINTQLKISSYYRYDPTLEHWPGRPQFPPLTILWYFMTVAMDTEDESISTVWLIMNNMFYLSYSLPARVGRNVLYSIYSKSSLYAVCRLLCLVYRLVVILWWCSPLHLNCKA